MEPHSPESWQLLLVGVTRQGFGKFFREMGGEVRGRETKMAYISAASSSVLALPQSALHSGWWGVTFHSSLLRALPQRPPPTALWHPNPTVSFYCPRQVFLQGIHPHSYTKHFSQVQAGKMEEGP